MDIARASEIVTTPYASKLALWVSLVFSEIVLRVVGQLNIAHTEAVQEIVPIQRRLC